MATIASIIEKKQTRLFNKYHAFFAFNEKQFKEKAERGFTYVNLGQGLLAPKPFYKSLVDKLDSLVEKGIAYHKRIESKQDIIWSQLANYECQITCDYSDALDALQGYGYLESEVACEYKKYLAHCVENDLF